MDQVIEQLRAKVGVVFHGFDAKVLPDGKTYEDMIGMDSAGRYIAMDAAYPLVTTANSGIPAMLSTYIDPKLINVLVAPIKAAEVAGGESKFGDWNLRTAVFKMVESTGEVTSYGDYNNSGTTGVNVQFPQRQSYHYQTITQWGERELSEMGLASIDLASQKNIASVLTINKYQNQTYLYGVSGLQNYGILNDPALPADIAPNTKAAGGTAWIDNTGAVKATPLEVQQDIMKLFWTLQKRNQGLIDNDTAMTLAMSPQSAVALGINNEFGNSVLFYLKETYPNMRIVKVPEYATAAGQKVQLIADEIEGQKTMECKFTEKMRAHPIITELSSFKQKKSAGTWGTVIYRPTFVQGMIGV